MMRSTTSKGFTTIELLIAMIVGALFLLTITQLYLVVTRDSTDVRNRTSASSAAYEILRKTPNQPQGKCITKPDATVEIPPHISLPPSSRATLSFSCPYGEGVAPSKIRVTVSYGTSKKVTYASYQAN